MNLRTTTTIWPQHLGEFSSALMDSVNAAQVGFHFEEGGCWGMAAALAEHFCALGKPVLVRYQPKSFVHAWVVVDGRNFDGDGEMLSTSTLFTDAVEIPAAQLAHLASFFGCSRDDFEADAQLARELVGNAWLTATEAAHQSQPTEVSA
jgi:hypothetical protein